MSALGNLRLGRASFQSNSGSSEMFGDFKAKISKINRETKSNSIPCAGSLCASAVLEKRVSETIQA